MTDASRFSERLRSGPALLQVDITAEVRASALQARYLYAESSLA